MLLAWRPHRCPVHYSTGLPASRPTAFLDRPGATPRCRCIPTTRRPRPRATKLRSLELRWPAGNEFLDGNHRNVRSIAAVVGVSLTCCWEGTKQHLDTRCRLCSPWPLERIGADPGWRTRGDGSDSVGNGRAGRRCASPRTHRCTSEPEPVDSMNSANDFFLPPCHQSASGRRPRLA